MCFGRIMLIGSAEVQKLGESMPGGGVEAALDAQNLTKTHYIGFSLYLSPFCISWYKAASLKNKNSLVLWLSLSPWITRHLCSPRGQIYLKAVLSSMLLNVQTHHKICHVTKAHVTHCAHMFLAAGVDFHVPKVFMVLWLLVRRKELQVLLSCIFNTVIFVTIHL